jgi:uncharacterized protein (TIRG00374 family)
MTDSQLSPEDLSQPSSRRWLGVGLLLAVVAIGLLVLASDAEAMIRAVGSVRPAMLLLPVLCTVASYSAMAASYQRIAATAGLDLPFGEMLKITLASTAANYVFSTGGLSGLALRSYFFSRQYGLRSGSAVSISLAQTFLTNFVLLAFLFWGLLNLLLDGQLHGSSELIVALLFVLSVVISCGAVAVVGSRSVRLRLFGILMEIPNLLSRFTPGRSKAIRTKLEFFEIELHEGVDFMISRGTKMIAPLAYIGLDWFLMLATLYAAFYCVDRPVPMHIVVIGFSTGVFLSLINLVPGGIGIMEGSMAAVFATFGVPLEPAVVATIIFRLSYYMLPLLITLIFFRQLLFANRARPGLVSSSSEPVTR